MRNDRPTKFVCPTCKVRAGDECEPMPIDNGKTNGSHLSRLSLLWDEQDRRDKKGLYA